MWKRGVHSVIYFTVIVLCTSSLLLPSLRKSMCEDTFSNSKIKVVGKFGETYTILEKDAYDEIVEKVKEKGLDSHYLSLKSKVISHTVVANNLGRANEDRTYKLSLSFQLPFDIKDHKGKIIYPKGYTFNPLKYVRLPFTLVFFDATSEKEIKWLRESGILKRYDTILIITRGSVTDTSDMLGRTVYLADETILKYFSISKTPSIVYQEGEKLVLKEVGVYKNSPLSSTSSNKEKKNSHYKGR